MFKLFLKIFSKQLGDYLLKANLELTVDKFDESNKKYLNKLQREGQMEDILKKMQAAIVKSGMAANTAQTIQQRKDWIDAFDYLMGIILASKTNNTIKVNPLTNKPLPKKK